MNTCIGKSTVVCDLFRFVSSRLNSIHFKYIHNFQSSAKLRYQQRQIKIFTLIVYLNTQQTMKTHNENVIQTDNINMDDRHTINEWFNTNMHWFLQIWHHQQFYAHSIVVWFLQMCTKIYCLCYWYVKRFTLALDATNAVNKGAYCLWSGYDCVLHAFWLVCFSGMDRNVCMCKCAFEGCIGVKPTTYFVINTVSLSKHICIWTIVFHQFHIKISISFFLFSYKCSDFPIELLNSNGFCCLIIVFETLFGDMKCGICSVLLWMSKWKHRKVWTP